MKRKGIAAPAYIELTIKISRERDGWVAVCEELGVSTCDDSLDHIVAEIQALIGQHLDALERNGVRAAFFRKHGIRAHSLGPASTHPQSSRHQFS